MRDSFVLFSEYNDYFNMVSDEDAGKIIKSIFLYQKSGIESVDKLSGSALMLYTIIINRLEKTNEAYETKCRQNAENGKKGGRPVKSNNEKPDGLQGDNKNKSNNRPVIDKTERLNKKPNGLFNNPLDSDLDSDGDIDSSSDTTTSNIPYAYDKYTVEHMQDRLRELHVEDDYYTYVLEVLSKKHYNSRSWDAINDTERASIFRAAVLQWSDLVSQYSDWKKQNIKSEQNKNDQISKIKLKPEICPHCHKKLNQDNADHPRCLSCNTFYEWDGKWTEYKKDQEVKDNT